MSRWRWYLSAAAVREYCRIAGLPDDDGGPAWAQAEDELGEIAEAAREYRVESHRTLYRTARRQVGDRQQRQRLELTVSTIERAEGDLPQLVRVRSLDVRSPEGHRDQAARRRAQQRKKEH